MQKRPLIDHIVVSRRAQAPCKLVCQRTTLILFQYQPIYRNDGLIK